MWCYGKVNNAKKYIAKHDAILLYLPVLVCAPVSARSDESTATPTTTLHTGSVIDYVTRERGDDVTKISQSREDTSRLTNRLAYKGVTDEFM